ncbi:hypothetical protein EAF04_010525 [Stromatinia cepivora]|nr:hypothetical protein EAF04_010525 [Stromatinia cepivora]
MIQLPVVYAFFIVLALKICAATTDNTNFCCLALSLAIGWSKVSYPNTTNYVESSVSYYAQQEGELFPHCFVKPASSEDVSKVVQTLVLLNAISTICPFAIRSGGHHTVVGIANIHSGITIDLRNINQTTINTDKTIAHVGTGARWGSVYSTLNFEGLAVSGGRVADIGVGGFITGGGLSYFGPAYGFGCDTVVNYEIVLADGKIANANNQENTDLFTALKGGSNNFGIVTRVDLKPFELTDYFGGQIFYLGTETPKLLDAFAEYSSSPDLDTRSFVLLTTLYAPNAGYIATSDFSYTEAIEKPPVFDNFLNIPNISANLRISNLTDFSVSLGSSTPNSLRQTSIAVTIKPSKSLLQQIYLLWNETVPQVSSAANLVYSLTLQPLPASMLNIGDLNGGNILGLNGSDGPLVVLTLTAQYTSAESDSIIESTTRQLTTAIKTLASGTGDLNPWVYLNYADRTQDVISSYGSANVKKMRAVSARVDPWGFFQKVQPGGFKL